MLKVSSWKEINIGPLVVMEQIGDQAYMLELPQDLEGIHDVFHVCHL